MVGIKFGVRGSTEKSLMELRNELTKRINHKIIVAQLNQVNNDISCGYLIYDKTENEVVFIGDEFRRDLCGEGGAGYKSAKALLSLFGIPPIWIDVDFDSLWFNKKKSVEFIEQNFSGELNEEGVCPMKMRPHYIRGKHNSLNIFEEVIPCSPLLSEEL